MYHYSLLYIIIVCFTVDRIYPCFYIFILVSPYFEGSVTLPYAISIYQEGNFILYTFMYINVCNILLETEILLSTIITF